MPLEEIKNDVEDKDLPQDVETIQNGNKDKVSDDIEIDNEQP